MKLLNCVALLLVSFCCHAGAFVPVKLTCNQKENPVGIAGARPVFGWQVNTAERNFMQTGYAIEVASDSVKFTGVTWKSGKINSAACFDILYNGNQLKPATTYYWRVKIYDKTGAVSAWSAVRSFTTGLFDNKDWGNAKWMAYETMHDSMRVVPGVQYPAKQLGNKARERSIVPYFRKEILLNKPVKKALAFVTGVGQYEFYINGQKIGDHFLSPGWTLYDKQVLYNSFDITANLARGNNAIGIMVGNGFYTINRERYFKLLVNFGKPAAICHIIIEYTDGSRQEVNSGAGWKATASPVTYSSMYGGEDYDARLEQHGWNMPGFNDAGWKTAIVLKKVTDRLYAEEDHPVKLGSAVPAQQVTEPVPGKYVYDFGKNAAGIVRIKLKGRKGQSIKITPAELLDEKLLANQKATGKSHFYTYTLTGDSVETWQPRFTYYGFRYAQVENADSMDKMMPQVIDIYLLPNSNATPVAGSFQCSNNLFNRIDTLIKNAVNSNLQSVVTDCPHREKLGWLEQDYLMGGSMHYNRDIHLLYRKIIRDMMDAQTTQGLVPDIAPEFVFFDDNGYGFRDSPEWGSACIILPWLLYKWYGDTAIMQEAYPMMQRYIAYLQGRDSSHVLVYGLGDWYDYGPGPPGVSQLTPRGVTATAIYYYDAILLSRMAALTGRVADSNKWQTLAAAIKAQFNKAYFDPTKKVIATGSQTAMAMPLSVGLVADQYRDEVFNNLQDSIRLSGHKLTAGDIGFHFLVAALQEGGADQLIFDMNNRDDVPGYGYQLKHGATTLTESWAALPVVSNNHLMLGHIMEWFYAGLAGIGQADTSIAYKTVTIAPAVVGDITWVKAVYAGAYGTISSAWKKTAAGFELEVNIPANSSAVVYLPASARDRIYEGQSEITVQKDPRFIKYERGKAVIKTGSGNYQFKVIKGN